MGEHDAAIREELERILASEPFVASPMLTAFLRHVVEEMLAGRGDRLKAYSIAVGALGRGEDFDPNDNPLVRVQARRLRQALTRFYETCGERAPVRLELPLGSYVPAVLPVGSGETAADLDADEALADVPPGAGAPAADAARPRRRVRRPLVATILLGLAVVASIVWYRSGGTPSPPAATPGIVAESPTPTTIGRDLDAAQVLPLFHVDVEIRDPTAVGVDAEIYRNRIETFARRFDDTVVVTRRSADFPTPIGQPLYQLRLLVAREGASINVYFRLVHTGDDRVVRSGALSLGRDVGLGGATTGPELAADLALVRDAIELHGAVTRDLASATDLSPELACLSRAWQDMAAPNREGFFAARDCLGTIVADDPRLVPALTALGTAWLGDLRRPDDPPREVAIGRAEELLRRAVRLAPTSAGPYRAIQSLLLMQGDVDAALLAGRRAVELAPDDMNAVGSYGATLARIGRWQEALPLLTRAASTMSSPPKWLQFHRFLALDGLERVDEADREVAFFDGGDSPIFLLAVAIRAHRRGDTPAAGAALSRVVHSEPDFAVDPSAYLRARGFADAAVARLILDLGRIGIPKP